jgi:membrane-bound lytic murein transglycosylase D
VILHKAIHIIKTFWNRSQKHLLAFCCFILLFVTVKLFSFSSDNTTGDNLNKDYINSHLKIAGLRIPKDLNFCGEKVPLSDFTVIESLDRELLINTYWQSQTLLLYKRANRCFTIIEPILKRNGIPDDFKYIPVVESALTNIVSPAKATGYWQIIEETGRNYGLEINNEIDERYSLERSTEAACRYFKEAYQKFKNWTLVAASYNMGIGGVSAQLDKQKVNSYYDLYLNDETARYIFRLLAVKDILSRPKAYGFMLRKQDLYPPIPTKKIAVDSSIINLADFALMQGINYKILKLLNPWLRASSLNNPEKKTYHIELPKQGVNIFEWGEFSNSELTLEQTDSVSETGMLFDSVITTAAHKDGF